LHILSRTIGSADSMSVLAHHDHCPSYILKHMKPSEDATWVARRRATPPRFASAAPSSRIITGSRPHSRKAPARSATEKTLKGAKARRARRACLMLVVSSWEWIRIVKMSRLTKQFRLSILVSLTRRMFHECLFISPDLDGHRAPNRALRGNYKNNLDRGMPMHVLYCIALYCIVLYCV